MNDFVKRVSQKIPKLSSEQLERIIDALYAENNTFDSILESLSVGLLIVDAGWKVIRRNKAAERLLPFAVHPGDPKAENLAVWQIIDDTPICAFLQGCADEQKTNAEDEFTLASESNVRFLTMTVVPLVRKEGSTAVATQITGSIITISDITEKRQQEILLRRMESLASLTNLAASVAHEIKNPLGAISIHIQLLQKSIQKARDGGGELPAPKFMERYLDVVNEEIDNLNKIVLDFLFAVRPVQATLQLSDPDALLSKLIAFFQPEFDDRSISVQVRLAKDVPRLLLDEKLFREVLMNIIQNALAAIDARFHSSKPTAGMQTDKAGELVFETMVKNDAYLLTIADNGCGMDEETASHIFEPYYTTKANGTGLGLTTVYKIVKEFRGDISVKSVEGHGTAFSITLPVPQHGIRLLPDAQGGTA